MKYKNNYTYSILNIRIRKEYLGVRSTNLDPTKDVGFKYFSSSKDQDFKQDQINNPQDYLYTVLHNFDTREEALKHEIYLHQINNVGRNPKFYNRSRQTTTGFDTTGLPGLCGKDNGMFGRIGELNPFYGKEHTSKTIKTIKNRYLFVNSFATLSLKKKFSEMRKGKSTGPFTQERKDNIGKAALGRKWYKNLAGTESVHVRDIVAPCYTLFGWTPGRVLNKKYKIPKNRTCPNCGRSFNPGNYTQHINKFCKHIKEKR